MNFREKEFNVKNEGITLIALVITIIVLLILAGVTLTTLTGNNGILTKTTEAKEETIIAEEKEEISIALSSIRSAKIVNNDKSAINAEELEAELKNNTNKNIKVTGEGILEVEYKDTRHIYQVDSEGNITESNIKEKVQDTTPGEIIGDGTELSPYQVESIEDLVALSQNVENGKSYKDKYFVLTTDLDFKSNNSYVDATRTDMGDVNRNGTIEELKIELTTGAGFNSIGKYASVKTDTGWQSKESYFDGIFDGQNHTIYNFYQDIQYYIDNSEKIVQEGFGLFGLTYSGLTVKNLNMETVSITSDVKYDDNWKIEIGAILGTCWEESSQIIIENCIVDGQVKANAQRLGGLVGSAWGNIEISNCKNYAEIFGGDLTGGIIGQCAADPMGKIENCENYGKIIAIGYEVGGITGEFSANSGYIKNCTNYGEINSNLELYYDDNEKVDLSIGGIAGYNGETIENCVNRGKIVIKTENIQIDSAIIGGVVGENSGKIEKAINLENIDFKNINAEDEYTGIGGIAGIFKLYEDSSLYIKNSYNTGNIIANNVIAVGGILGNSYINIVTDMKETYTIANCYNVGKITGKESVGGIIGKDTFYAETQYSTRVAIANVKNSYNVGKITGTKNVGGIVGIHSIEQGSVIENSYYLSGSADVAYTTDKGEVSITETKSEEEMKNEEFVNLLNQNNEEKIWIKNNENNEYPSLNF